jgi:integrase/recombinase XerC
MVLREAIERFDLRVKVESVEGTRKLYEYSLKKLSEFLGPERALEDISIDDLRRWLDKISTAPKKSRRKVSDLKPKKLSVRTIHRDVRQIKTFFKWCVEEGHLDVSPALRLKPPKLPRGEPPKAVSDVDRDRMIDLAREESIRDLAIVLFLAETGCRVGGLVDLRFGDLDLDELEAIVREKGKKARKVHFGEATAQALRAWLVTRPREKWEDFVFVGRRGPLTTSGVYRVLERLAKASGVEGRYNPHSFRHALARRLLKNRADLGTVAEILGHYDPTVTHEFYARWEPDELAERHRQFGGVIELRR